MAITTLEPIITAYDLVGEINISTTRDDTADDLDLSIVRLQERYLKRLFGESMYADMFYNSDEAKYQTLINGLDSFYEVNGQKKMFTGLKKMLANFVYWHFTQQQNNANTPFGNIQPDTASGKIVTDVSGLCAIYNEGVTLFNEAATYILEMNKVDGRYSDFEYSKMKTINVFGI